MNTVFIQALRQILALAIPAIAKLIESKVVPKLKRKAYERLDDFTTDKIEDLANLLDKIKTTKDETKKQAHIEGFKLGLEALKAIANKLTKAAEILENKLNE